MSRISLQKQLLILVMATMIPLFFLHEAIEISEDISTVRQHTAADVRNLATALLPLLKSALIIGDLATAQETLDNIANPNQFRYLRLLDAHAEQILLEGRPKPAQAIAPPSTAPEWFVTALDFRFQVQEFPVAAGGEVYGVLVAEPSAIFLVAHIWERLYSALLIWLFTLALLALLLKFILHRGLQPIENLAATAHRFGSGDLSCRATIGDDAPEVAETAQAFNTMAASLAESREKLEGRVRQATRELENLITRIPVGIYKMRMLADGGICYDFVSPRWCALLDLDETTIRRDPWALLSRLHPEESKAFAHQFDDAKASLSPFSWEGRLRDGLPVRWLRIEAMPTVLDNGDILWEGILYDISAGKLREEELDHIAHFDQLTGIPNRVLLADRMRQAIAHAQRAEANLAVCYLDLDGFKPVNDALGHKAGDVVLIEIARRLNGTVRGDDTVARIGGDEFVLLLSGMSGMDEYEAILKRILEAVRAPIVIGCDRVSVSASIGISLYPQDDSDPDILLRHADQAMYLAKQAGRGKFHFFDLNLEEAARRHRDLLHQIEHGLTGNEFELYYQPKVNMRLGTVLGFEALIRWWHPEKGLLLPKDFLPLIEDNDLIIALGEWVISQALGKLGEWHRQGLDLTISVNIAPRHLEQEGFVERLRALIAIHADAPAEKLEIEIVESSALSDTDRIYDLIAECRKMGVSFALDDFGTGYSSLTYLKSLPAQTLKIDQSFVRDMLVDANDLAIVEGVIGLTEIFHRRVVAEGVESVEHGTLLMNLGCEVAQGYGIARPMPAEAIDEWLRTWKPNPAWKNGGSSLWTRDDLPLIVAESNHRAWIDALIAFVNGAVAEIPELDGSLCRFGKWYVEGGQRRYGTIAEFSAIATVHARVHELGGALVALVNDGRTPEAQAKLPELVGLRDELLLLLRRLVKATGSSVLCQGNILPERPTEICRHCALLEISS
ncbi:MAG: EAL domain-containing protein [Desulfurivibrionaceae bacterium]